MSATLPPIRRLWPAFALGAIVLASEGLRGVLGQVALYPLLGAFPGLALAWLLLRGASPTTRWVVGFALAPLISSMLGWALIASGVEVALASRAIGWSAWLIWVLLLARSPVAPPDEDPGEQAPPSRAVGLLAAALAVAIVIGYLANQPWMLIKSDAWAHVGIMWDILERGMPPQDARFAGLHLNYVWFFNLFVGMLVRLHDGDPFVFMAIHNVVDVALIAWVGYLAGWMLWRGRDAAVGAAFLTCFGFNAFAYVLWPLRGATAFFGEHRGLDAFRAAYAMPAFTSWRIMADLSAPFGWFVNFVDKFVTGTSIHYSWLLMMLLLWAMVRLIRGPSAGGWIVAMLASAGMQLWHGVVGLSVVPVAGCAVALALALRPWWRWLPPAGRLLSFGAAIALGFALVLPYTLDISRGWAAGESGLHVAPVRLDYRILIAVATSCAFAFVLALGPLRDALRERRGEVALVTIDAAGILAFSILIALPNFNETKFAFLSFVPLALLGGPSFLPWVRGVRRRFGAIGFAILCTLLALPHVLTLTGFALDREHLTAPALHPAPGENDLYAWIRTHSHPRDVFVDARYRDLIMVRARRQLYLGSDAGPEKAAFPLKEVLERRAVMADLYGPASELNRDAAALARLGRPVFVLIRPSDEVAGSKAGMALAARPDLFRPLYDRDGFVLYAVVMPDSTPSRGSVRP